METRLPSLIKPTIHTSFKIDFDWWKSHDRNWHIYMRGFLCQEHQTIFADIFDKEQIDWVDPVTAEVTPVDALQHILVTHCAKEEGFLTDSTALVDSVFKIFLTNGNKPLTSQQLSEILGKPANIILRTFATPRVYKGIRPIPGN